MNQTPFRTARVKRLTAFLFLLSVLLSSQLFPQRPFAARAEQAAGETSLLCLNIGKADCMLLTCGTYHYLIDTGYAQTWPALETALHEEGITRLDGVFLTHCHEDHAGGLMPLAESGIAVDAWYASPLTIEADDLSEHPAALAAAVRGQDVRWLLIGDVIPIGADASLTVLGPLYLNTDNENNNSLVMIFSSPQGSILLTGDMKEDEAEDLADAGLFSPCELLKVSHHGDNHTISQEMLAVIQPKVAVIPTDTRQEPDTPAPSVLKMLKNAGCQTVVTQDVHDAVRFTLSGGTVSVEDVHWAGIPARAEGIGLTVDRENDTVTIRNEGTVPLSLQGCVLYSTRGNETLTLSAKELPPGGSWVIGSRRTSVSVDETWPEKKVWHQKKRDTAILYDPWGRPLAITDNGLTD